MVTASDAWRARAVAAGLDRAKVWIGDVGVWNDNPEYVDLPSVMTRASFVTDPSVHEPSARWPARRTAWCARVG